MLNSLTRTLMFVYSFQVSKTTTRRIFLKLSMKPDDSSIGDETLQAFFRSCAGSAIPEDAAAKFANCYMEKLLALIQRNIADRFQARFDADDVVQSVLNSWFQGVRRRSIHPTSSTEIWPLISVMALNKVRNRIRFNQAHIRDVRRSGGDNEILESVPSPTPDEAFAFEDMLQAISAALQDDSREVLRLILEGCSVAEIADQLKISTRTVARRKKDIRKQILKHLPEELRGVAEQLAAEDDE